MPLNTYTDAATQELLAKMEADLSYLFDELNIPERIQANIAERGIVHLGVFAKVEPTEESFRNWLKDDLELDPAANIGNRVIVAKLAEAWSAAGQRATTARRLDAEARVTGQPREMLKGVHLTLRRACLRQGPRRGGRSSLPRPGLCRGSLGAAGRRGARGGGLDQGHHG